MVTIDKKLVTNYRFLPVFVIALSFVIIPVYSADPFDQFAYQGLLQDSNGNVITATKDITLNIYTTLTGGSSLWSEDHDNVSVSNGLFTIYAGSQTPFSDSLNFINALYLETIIIDSDGSNAETLSPRIKIAGSPFALSASRASTDFDVNQKNLINATSMGIGTTSQRNSGCTLSNSSHTTVGLIK